mgnify:FL=1
MDRLNKTEGGVVELHGGLGLVGLPKRMREYLEKAHLSAVAERKQLSMEQKVTALNIQHMIDNPVEYLPKDSNINQLDLGFDYKITDARQLVHEGSS